MFLLTTKFLTFGKSRQEIFKFWVGKIKEIVLLKILDNAKFVLKYKAIYACPTLYFYLSIALIMISI